MNKLSKFIKSTGNLLGNSIEDICENTGEVLYKNFKKIIIIAWLKGQKVAENY